MNPKLIYFISDIHLGLDTENHSSADREKILAEWLISISSSATDIYFLGDIFDYWFEYKNGSTPQYPTFYSALRSLKTVGVSLFFFTGNHDMWMKTYFKEHFDIEVYHNPLTKQISAKKFYLAHGDGLGKGDYSYKLMKAIMRNPLSIFLYGMLPSKIGLGLMKYMSQKSRKRHGAEFISFENERLVDYSRKHAQASSIDFYIMGHRHLMFDYELSPKGPRYINLGDWIEFQSYAIFNGLDIELKTLTNREEEILR